MGKKGRDRGSRRRFDEDDSFGAREARYDPRANHFEERPAKMRPPVAPRSTPLSNGSTMRRASASLSWGWFR